MTPTELFIWCLFAAILINWAMAMDKRAERKRR
jgi:hypothetical protein